MDTKNMNEEFAQQNVYEGEQKIKQIKNRAFSWAPLNRGSITAEPWRPFFKLFGSSFYKFETNDADALAPLDKIASKRRSTLVGGSFFIALFAVWLLTMSDGPQDFSALYITQLTLFTLLFTWVAVGFMTAAMGVWVMLKGDSHSLSSKNLGTEALDKKARTAIIMPICNEDVSTVFAGLKSTINSLSKNKYASQFDFFVLSDTSNAETRAQEVNAWSALKTELKGAVNVYYRWRMLRTKRKSGNVEDFCRRWGQSYRYMVVLDADSIMTGEALEKLVRLMEENPSAGIIQTAPKTCGLDTLHARVQQFSSRMVGRVFTLGMQYWQLGESHYWGHNAIIRVKPFMEYCALAPIQGTHNLSGHILSHDFLEAALMRRAGYRVWLVSDLEGSYEQQPPSLTAELQRDRRWCQGNLQNIQLLTQPGLHPAHRAMLLTGVMSYVSAPLWLMFIIIGSFMGFSGESSVMHLKEHSISWLWVLTGAMLLLPRFMGMAAAIATGEAAQYGGVLKLIRSTCLEAVLAMFQAPIRMAAHSIFVFGAITGWKLEWKSPPREAQNVSYEEAKSFFGTISVVALLTTIFCVSLNFAASIWLLPILVPLVLAVPLAMITGHLALGEKLRSAHYLIIPEETKIPGVITHAENILTDQHFNWLSLHSEPQLQAA